MRLLVVPLALVGAAACGDRSLNTQNTNPVASITSPTDGSELREPYPVTISGRVEDREVRPELLFATWLVNGVEACPEANADESGVTTCTFPATLGNMVVELSVRDGYGGTDSVSATYTGVPSAAPVAEIRSPDPARRYYANVPVPLRGHLSDEEDGPEALLGEWALGGVSLGEAAAPDATGLLEGAQLLPSGEHTLTLTATDAVGKTGTDSVTITVGGDNRPPSCTILAPFDGGYHQAERPVTLSGLVDDLDEGPATLTVAWSSDIDGSLGTSTPSSTGEVDRIWTLPSAGAHTLTLTATDEAGVACTHSIEWIAHDPPSVQITAPAANTVRNEGETIAFVAQIEDDLDPVDSLAVLWESDAGGFLGTSRPDSTGLTELPVEALAPGWHAITATVADFQGLEGNATLRVRINGVPEAPTVQITPTAPTSADDLRGLIAVPSVDPESDPVTYQWAWTKLGQTTPAATTQVLPSSATATGETWIVTATPSDGRGQGPAGTARVTVGNTPPVVTAVRIFPAFPRVGDRMRCEADGEDAEGSEVSFSFAWKINGVSTGVFGAQVDGLAFERDDVVTCVATPHDGSSAGTPDEADALVANTPPVATPSFDPAIPSGGEDLRCVAEGEDADGDSLNFRYAWTVNDVSQAVTGNTLPGARFQSGDTVACQVWANDGRQEGEPGSVQALVGNGAPSLARVVLNTYSPVPTQDLVATPEGYSDPDGDAAGDHRFAWYVQAYGTGPWRRVGDDSDTLSSVEYGKHDKVYVEVTPVDEHGAAGEPVDSETATVIVTWSKLAGADSHTCGIQPDGSLWCWGQNNIGQLGTGSTAQATSRVRIGAERAWADVAAGGPQAQGFTCAVDRTGGLWCWGYNGFGQLGTGNAQPQYVPTRVGSESDWAAVSAGQTHACALKTDRSAWCWGHNHVGQLGDASTANRSTPVRVGTGNTWTHVDAGTNFTCGLTADRTAWCWGYNNSGQLGIGSIVGSTTPRSVGSHSGWVQIFAGDSHACGRKSSGEVLCWGSGGNGRLGNGSVAAQTSPVSVQGVFAELSGGQIHNCARDEDDALWCWGHGANGRLGLGDQSQRTQPTQVGSEEDWTNIFTMGAHTCGLRGEGALWCWGYNTYGQLGLGTVGDRLAPNEVEPD